MPAHRTFLNEEEIKKKKKYTLPSIEGRFGISFNIGLKEVFIGIQITDTFIEKIIRKRLVKANKGKVNVFKFD